MSSSVQTPVGAPFLGTLQRRVLLASLDPLVGDLRPALNQLNLDFILRGSPGWWKRDLASRLPAVQVSQIDWLSYLAGGQPSTPSASGPDGFFPASASTDQPPPGDLRKAAYAAMVSVVFAWAEASYRAAPAIFEPPQLDANGGLPAAIRMALQTDYAAVNAALTLYDSTPLAVGYGPLRPLVETEVERARAGMQLALKRVAGGFDYASSESSVATSRFIDVLLGTVNSSQDVSCVYDPKLPIGLSGYVGNVLSSLFTQQANAVTEILRTRVADQQAVATDSRLEGSLALQAARLQLQAEQVLLQKVQLLAQSAERRAAAATLMTTEAQQRLMLADYLEKAAAADSSSDGIKNPLTLSLSKGERVS